MSSPPDFTCPNGHRIPEQIFSAEMGCVVLGCTYRRDRAAPIDMEAARRALRGVEALPAASLDGDGGGPALITAWPAELAEEEGAAVVEPPKRGADEMRSDTLKMIVERILALRRQRQEINEIIGDVRAFAKGIGFDPKAIGVVVAMMEQDPGERKTFEAIVDVYRHALGIDGPDFAVALPPVAAAAAPEPRPSRAVANRRSAVMLAELARQARGDFG